MAGVIKLWLREPRKAWRNDGGPIPRQFRGRCSRDKTKTVTIHCPLHKVRVGHWVVQAGSQLFGFSPAQMRKLYSRTPL